MDDHIDDITYKLIHLKKTNRAWPLSTDIGVLTKLYSEHRLLLTVVLLVQFTVRGLSGNTEDTSSCSNSNAVAFKCKFIRRSKIYKINGQSLESNFFFQNTRIREQSACEDYEPIVAYKGDENRYSYVTLDYRTVS